MKIFRSWTFGWKEVGMLKLCLISLGILLAIYFADYLRPLEWLWWATFVIPAIYFIARFFREA